MRTLTREYGYLKRRYPFLKQIKFYFGTPEGNRHSASAKTKAVACYSPAKKAIIMSHKEFRDDNITMYTLLVFLHEVRHALQDEEGWEGGWSKWSAARLERDADEWAWKEYYKNYHSRYCFGSWSLRHVFSDHLRAQKNTYGVCYREWYNISKWGDVLV